MSNINQITFGSTREIALLGNNKHQISQPKSYFSHTDASNDGKFSFWEATKNFGKGLVSPFTAMFSSVPAFLMGAGMMVGGALLIAATGGAILPLLTVVGVTFGIVQCGLAAYQIATAKDGDDIEKAFHGFGAATSSIGLSFLGAKTALRASGTSTAGMSRTQAVIASFKNAPKSIKNSFINIKKIPSKIKSAYLFFKAFREQYKKHMAAHRQKAKQIKQMADEVYNEEMKLLAKRLGVSEEKLRHIMPKEVDNTAISFLGGLNLHLRKPYISINPQHIVDNKLDILKGVTIRDRLNFTISHEVFHSEQRIFPMTQLTFREYRQLMAVYRPNFGTRYQNLAVRLIQDIQSYLRYYSSTGRRIRALKIPKTKANRIKAAELLIDEMNVGKANAQAMQGNKAAYDNSNFEVGARMYSLQRRLEIFNGEVSQGKGVKMWKPRFESLQDELVQESTGFLNPTDQRLLERIRVIESSISTAKNKLLAHGIKPAKPNPPPAILDEIPKLKLIEGPKTPSAKTITKG